MKISILQPCFVPWLGYFEQIAVADIFVYMDDVQYTKRDWRNTNLLRSPYGARRIFVPVQKTSRSTLIKEVKISYQDSWESTLINKLNEWYKKSKYFDEVMEFLFPIILSKPDYLVDLNYHLNNALLTYLEIETPIEFSSSVPKKTSSKNERILEICQHFGATILYDGKSAASFIDTELFNKHGITVIFQDYKHTAYSQIGKDFIPYMSVLDLVMNEGKNSRNIILSNPLPRSLTDANS